MNPLLLLIGIVSATTSLNSTSLSKFLETTHPVVGMFHVNWCGSCRRTLPEFQAAATVVKSVKFFEFDCTDESDYCSKTLNVSAYPALRIWTKPGTDFIDIPYYERSREAIAEYVQRAVGPAIIEQRRSASQLISHPSLGRRVSLVGVGYSKTELERIISDIDLVKLRFQILVTDEPPTGVTCKKCLIIIPKILFAQPLAFPVLESPSASVTTEWIWDSQFPAVWRLDDPPTFQYFTDQSKYKVLFNGRIGGLDGLVNSIGKCEGIGSKFTFGVLNADVFADALSEFGSPEILVLNNEVHDFMRYYTFSVGGDLCGQLESILRGESSLQFRGGFLTKLNYKFAEFLSVWFGIESQSWRIAIVMGLAGLGVVMILALVSKWTDQGVVGGKKND
jgi:thiol-disulfide isomerase/thioredoxin